MLFEKNSSDITIYSDAMDQFGRPANWAGYKLVFITPTGCRVEKSKIRRKDRVKRFGRHECKA